MQNEQDKYRAELKAEEAGAAAESPAAPRGRSITIEQRKRAQAKRLAASLRANLLKRKAQARQLKAQSKDE